MNIKTNLLKLSVTVLLTVTLMFSAIGVITANAYDKTSMYLLGDVNKDNKVTVRDATIIQMYLCRFKEYLFISDIQLKAADVNEDGIVDILDATIIQKHKVGIDTKTRIEQQLNFIELITEPASDNQWLPGFFD